MTNHEGKTGDEPYRMTFGKHRGSTIQELTPGYRRFLIQEKAHESYPDLKAALITGGYLQPTQGVNPEPVSPTRKRKASEQTVLPAPQPTPQPSKRPTLSARQGHEDATLHTGNQQVADLYILDFGMHAGKRLRDVPSNYVDWLIGKEVYTSRPALATALRALGRLDAPGPALQYSTWRAPPVSSARDPCFFEPMFDSPLWISDKDAATYFNLRDPTLARAGVRLLGAKDLDMYVDGGSTLCFGNGRRRWLYQVFACAEHFNTASPGTARQAVQRFLHKNKLRESEIMAELGLG